MKRLKLKNIPVPEAHVVSIILGVLLHLIFRIRIFDAAWIGPIIGWPLILSGTGLIVWAVLEVGETDISSAERLITSGPYAFSRNPMYVGWFFISLGIAFVLNSIWLIVLLPFVGAYIHLIEIPKEEKLLEQQFGSQYKEYRNRVRKYL